MMQPTAPSLEEAEQGQVVKGIPIKAGPGVLGAPQPELPASTASLLLDLDEQSVVNYAAAVWCFAFLDIFSTGLNVVAAYGAGLPYHNWQLLGFLLLLGPFCGMMGASLMNRHLVLVFVLFCFLKAGAQVFMALSSFWLWPMLFALLQCWITKIAATFWWVLGKLSPERRQRVLEAKDLEVHKVYF